MKNGVMQCDVMCCVLLMLSDVMLSGIILGDDMRNVALLSDVMLNFALLCDVVVYLMFVNKAKSILKGSFSEVLHMGRLQPFSQALG
jgi:hypothetical protein